MKDPSSAVNSHNGDSVGNIWILGQNTGKAIAFHVREKERESILV